MRLSLIVKVFLTGLILAVSEVKAADVPVIECNNGTKVVTESNWGDRELWYYGPSKKPNFEGTVTFTLSSRTRNIPAKCIIHITKKGSSSDDAMVFEFNQQEGVDSLQFRDGDESSSPKYPCTAGPIYKALIEKCDTYAWPTSDKEITNFEEKARTQTKTEDMQKKLELFYCTAKLQQVNAGRYHIKLLENPASGDVCVGRVSCMPNEKGKKLKAMPFKSWAACLPQGGTCSNIELADCISDDKTEYIQNKIQIRDRKHTFEKLEREGVK